MGWVGEKMTDRKFACPVCDWHGQTAKALEEHARSHPGGPKLTAIAPGEVDYATSVVRAYVRVSSDDQDNENQRFKLRSWIGMKGYVNVEWYEDVMTGSEASRPGLQKLLADVRRGDVFLVVRADRFARSMIDFTNYTAWLHNAGVHIACVDQPVDTTSPMGRAFWSMLGVFAQLERELLIARVKDFIRRARAEGRVIGRHHNRCGYDFPCPKNIDHRVSTKKAPVSLPAENKGWIIQGGVPATRRRRRGRGGRKVGG